MNNNYSISRATCVWFCVCVLLGMQIFLSDVYAASNKDDDFNKLISRADVIVFGKCTSVTSQWRKKKIYSAATIQIENVIKGDPTPVIQVEYMGGTAMHPKLNSPVTMSVSNAVSFEIGDEAVLMLKKLTNNSFQVIGAERGKINVLTDETGEKIIQSGARKILSKPSVNGDSAVVSGKAMSLAEFKDFIQTRQLNEKERVKQ